MLLFVDDEGEEDGEDITAEVLSKRSSNKAVMDDDSDDQGDEEDDEIDEETVRELYKALKGSVRRQHEILFSCTITSCISMFMYYYLGEKFDGEKVQRMGGHERLD